MKPIFYAYLITVVVLSGCSSGKGTFERGNYYEAVITSVNRLRKNNDHKKSVETLRQAYPMAVAFYEDRAKTSLASSERFKWSEVVKSYTLINTMYDEIKRCPGALAVVPNPINYFSKLQEARQNAAEENYAAGILALQGNTRESAKQAYSFFKITNEYVQGYKEVNDYLQAALSAATVKIVVEPIPVHSRSVGVSAEFFNDKISEFVHSAPINEFVKFYTRAEAQKIKLNPDHIIQLQFDDFTVGEVYRHEKEVQLTKDSVIMGTYVSPSTAASVNTETNKTPPPNGNRLVYTGAGVVASSGTPSNQNTSNTQTTEADRERAARDLAEKARLEQEQKALADKMRAEKEAAEREQATKTAEAQKAAEAAAAKAQAEKTEAEKAAAERERLAREAEAARIAKEAAEKAKRDEEQSARDLAEKQRLEKEKADKEAAEKALADKVKAEKDKAEKDKAEKDKADKEKSVDPTIAREDTLNVTDPVFICHMPPGNKSNSRTLKINRSALKAHLAHGDAEGACENDKKENKIQNSHDEKGKPKDEPKKPQEEKKGKGPGGAQISKPSMLFTGDDVLLASGETDAESILRYLAFSSSAGDTNKVYGTVKATLYHYTKTTTSKGIVSFKIIDAKTGALLTVEKMPGEFVWKSEWATFNGDERALSAEHLRLAKQKELPPPAPQELFIEFTRPIYDQITTKIRNFYKNY